MCKGKVFIPLAAGDILCTAARYEPRDNLAKASFDDTGRSASDAEFWLKPLRIERMTSGLLSLRTSLCLLLFLSVYVPL